MNKNLFETQQTQPKELPSTPRKKSQFKELTSHQTPRIKYRYTVVQKPKSTWLGNLFALFWVVLILGAFAMNYQSRMTLLQNSIADEIEKCQKDFTSNKCETPIKAVKLFCEEKAKCINLDKEELLRTRMQGMLFLGETIREFFEGLGLPLVGILMVYLIFGNRKNTEVKKQFVEYC